MEKNSTVVVQTRVIGIEWDDNHVHKSCPECMDLILTTGF